jgi:FtsZ-interacting cell division protein ZipA
MKKIVLSIIFMVIAITVVGVNFMLDKTVDEKQYEQLKQEEKIESVDEKIDTEDIAVKEEKKQEKVVEKSNETEKYENKETISKSTKKPSSSVSNVPKQENSSSSNSTPVPQQPTQSTTQDEQTNSNTQNNNTEQKTNVSTSFYDSITGGKKEFSSESACFARGTQIQNAELNYVLDYNEQHPNSPMQPEINYFRCYPVIDNQGEGWYLHFFCRSGEGLDSTLKSKY